MTSDPASGLLLEENNHAKKKHQHVMHVVGKAAGRKKGNGLKIPRWAFGSLSTSCIAE